MLGKIAWSGLQSAATAGMAGSHERWCPPDRRPRCRGAPANTCGTSKRCTTTSGTPIWAGAPALVDVKQGGRLFLAVAVIGKMGLLFLLDRVTGKPLYGVEERPVPQSELPLERTSKTQPFPLKPPPLSRMTMSPGEDSNRN